MEVDGDAITSLLLKMFRDLHRAHATPQELQVVGGEALLCHTKVPTAEFLRGAVLVDPWCVTYRHLVFVDSPERGHKLLTCFPWRPC